MMSIENKIKLLWDCGRTLKGDNKTHKLLKSNYINICRNISKTTIQIPKEKFAISQMCPFCSSFWIESEFSLKLKSQQVTNNSKTSKLLEKFDKSKDINNKANLSRKQRNRAKWLKKRVTNCIEINCHQCKHKSLVKMEKPEKRVDNQITKPNKNEQIKCKKSGFKNTHGNKTVHIKNIKTVISNAPTKSQKLHSRHHGGFANLQSPYEHKTSKIIKINKVVSKTQKQNSVLQLAALLQKQSSSNGKTLAHQRLETLLK